MSIEFRASKSGLTTCSVNGFSVHSNYNPENEAKKFVDNIQADFFPKNIVITGPCLHYLSTFLKIKFPNSKIIAIQYSNKFNDYNQHWDKVFFVNETTNTVDFQEELFNFFGEEEIFQSLFLSWKPSDIPFQKESTITWNSIREAIKKAKSVVGTISYFNKTWFKNSVHFFLRCKNFYSISNINVPILVTASGPSLKSQLEFIKNNQNYFFILALSSSLTVLLENSIIPDAVLTTDGGYYAKRHLKILETNINYKKIPIIAPPEAKISSKILENNMVIPLDYGDGIFTDFITLLNIKSLKGIRNGTVSGTSAELALSLTKENIYFAGLDLSSSKGFSHTQNNILELDSSITDNKISSKENRITPSTFINPSLEIYRNWFATRNQNFYKRIFRLTSTEDNLIKIPNLEDIENSKILFSNKKSYNLFIIDYEFEIEKLKSFFISEKIKIEKEDIKIFEWFKIVNYTSYIQFSRAIEETKYNLYTELKQMSLKLIDDVLQSIDDYVL